MNIPDLGRMDLSNAKIVTNFPMEGGVVEVHALMGKPEACSWIHTQCLQNGGGAILDPTRIVDEALNCELDLNDTSRRIWRKVYDEQEKRVSHCLRRLKAKKLYGETDDDVLDLMRGHDMATSFMSRELIYSALFVVQQTKIPEDLWKTAIEMTVYLTHREVFFQADALYAAVVERNLETLYTLVLLLHGVVAGNFLYKRLQSYFYEGGMEEFMEACASVAQVNEGTQKELKRYAAAKAQSDKRASDAAAELDKARRENERLRKQLLGRDAKIRALERVLESSEEDNDDEQELVLDDTCDVPETAVSDVELPDLPESGVWFVGGAEPLRKRLMALYPDWNFIDAKDDAFAIPQRCTAVFLFYKHISHKIANRVRDNMPKSAKLFYVSSCNVNLLVRDMKEQYAAAQDAD